MNKGGNVVIFSFRKPILLRSVRARIPLLDAVLMAKGRKGWIDIFGTTITLENYNSGMKQVMNHGNKGFKVIKDLRFSFHRINPGITGKIVIIEYIVMKTTDRRN